MSLSPEELSEIQKSSPSQKNYWQRRRSREADVRSPSLQSQKLRKPLVEKARSLLLSGRWFSPKKKRGVPVIEIARKHGVTANYVYQMK